MSLVEPLLPTHLGDGRVHYARGMRAGPWVFATGIMATDARTGLLSGRLSSQLPLHGEPRGRIEAELVFDRAHEVIAAGGADLDRIVRLDQFFSDARAVSSYQAVRKARLGRYVPPSTSILQPGCALPGATMEVSLIALSSDARCEIEAFAPPELDVPAGAGFSPVVACGDYVFIAGFMAAWKPGDLGGIAPEAQMPPGHLWKGSRIELETEYLIERKLMPALHAAGASKDSVVKAHIYLRDIEDLPGCNRVWRRHFGASPPASLVVQTARPGFAIEDARVEINLLALRSQAGTTKATIESARFVGMSGQPAAVRAGDLLLISGLMALTDDGPAPGVMADARAPHFGSTIEAQMEHILDTAEDICHQAGASLDNVVRVQQFHTDLAEFYPAYRVWQRRLRSQPVPFSALRVLAPHAVAPCTVLVDLWVYAP
ncbi:MAG TPA: RidA family protein [Casimicrobiaceae bacterium]|nr:RidA family protein [Casimicrobiaceae bacterium]